MNKQDLAPVIALAILFVILIIGSLYRETVGVYTVQCVKVKQVPATYYKRRNRGLKDTVSFFEGEGKTFRFGGAYSVGDYYIVTVSKNITGDRYQSIKRAGK